MFHLVHGVQSGERTSIAVYFPSMPSKKKNLFGSGIKLYCGCRSSEMFFPFQGEMAGLTECECVHPINLLYFYLIIIFYSKH
jgi:hypothetical protein